MTPLRIATRGSRQAMTQAGAVADRLRDQGHDVELVQVDTLGDRTQVDGVPLHSIGGIGVFVKEVQQAVLDGRADVAVHSAKDLPTSPVDGLTIGAFMARRNPADALVGKRLSELAPAATVATGSVRRRALLGELRPDLAFTELRGNIDTRLNKVPDDGAIVMAVAALELLNLTDRIAEVLDPTVFVPAVGQGCVAVEVRTDDPDVARIVGELGSSDAHRDVSIERSFLARFGAGCSSPIGAYSDGDNLYAFVGGSQDVIHERLELSGDLAADRAAAGELADVVQRAAGLISGTDDIPPARPDQGRGPIG